MATATFGRISLLACVLILLAALPVAASPAVDYSAPGPYGAGWQLVDVTRPDGTTFSARLYYPAKTKGRGATYDPSGGPYPAISFGHGYQTPVFLYHTTFVHLASWGYFVIATQSGLKLFPDHALYARDLLYCLDYLQAMNASMSSWLSGQVDTGHFGLAGHSMGGGASILAAAQDTRIKALANLAAAETRPSAKAAMPDVKAPARLIVGSEDKFVPPAVTLAMYDKGRAPKQFVNIEGGGHCGFLDGAQPLCNPTTMPVPEQRTITQRLLTEFFNLYLGGDQEPWRQVWGPERDSDPKVVTTIEPGIAVTPESQGKETLGGATAKYTLQVTNTGPAPASYTLFAEDHAWPVAFTPPQTAVLSPGQAATVTAAVSLPAGANGTDGALISARSDVDGGTRAYATLTTRGLPFEAGIGKVEGGLLLTWTASAADCQYEVYRGATPHFTPGPGTLIQTLPPGTSSYTDGTPGVVGDPVVNYAYVARANCGDSNVDSKHLGEFDFALVR